MTSPELHDRQLQIRMSPTEKEQLRVCAENRGMTMSQLMRTLIREASAALPRKKAPKKKSSKKS